MVERNRLLSLSYYEKAPFTGSDRSLRYRIEKHETEGNKQLIVYAWNGLYSYECTPHEEMTTHLADFSDDGLDDIVSWLNNRFAQSQL